MDWPAQIEVEEAAIVTCGLTEAAVMVMVLEEAVGLVAQRALEVITTETWSASASEEEVKVTELVPAFTRVAVKVTDCPAQIEVEEAAMVTCGLTEAAVMVMVLEAAVGVVAQRALEVITTETWSASASEEEVKVTELVPAFIPFTFHW